MQRKTIAVFDFDGTLTKKDTLIEFIKFTCGVNKLIRGILYYLPYLILMKMNLYPNWKVKEKLFSFFFKGWLYSDFVRYGKDFLSIIELFERKSILALLEKHISRGDIVIVITASIEEWVSPWCYSHGVNMVLGTKIDMDVNGLITGRFKTKNCYGIEKVNRLLEVEPDRKSYYLYAYGDSKGDKEMMLFSDECKYVGHKG